MKEFYKIYAWTECPYCVDARELLVKNKKQFMFCCIDESGELLSYIKKKYNWMTVPLVVKCTRDGPEDGWREEFIGGYSDLIKKFECESG